MTMRLALVQQPATDDTADNLARGLGIRGRSRLTKAMLLRTIEQRMAA